MRRIFTALLALAATVSCTQKAEPLSEQMVHSQMSRCGDATYLDYTDGRLKWNYTPGLELRSFLVLCKSRATTQQGCE